MQGLILGYCYRQKLVHQVRAEYEQVVAHVQPQKDFPFADESVTWPCKDRLCYPVFQTVNMREEVMGEPPQVSAPQRECDAAPEAEVGEEKEQLVFNKDRQSLLEIRSKLGMELVWLKQAITSRQKV